MKQTAALLVVLFVAVVGLQAAHDRRGPLPMPEGVNANLLYVQSSSLAQRIALSYDSLLADVYWIRALQHYGRTKLGTESTSQYQLLYPLLDLTTSLDPRFDIAYRFGAIFLSEAPPEGPGRPDQAVALLEKGLRAQPDRWQYAGDIGFVYYFWVKDYERAAQWFRRARAMPNGPEWMAAMAATVLAEGGNRASSRRLWQEVLTNEEAAYLQQRARLRLGQLDAMDQIDALAPAIDAFRQRTGAAPTSWRQLAQAGYVRGIPVDPSGHPYVLDAATGEITVSPESPLFPLPPRERSR
jgi:tetratricopeptide (TPR) repeat protein